MRTEPPFRADHVGSLLRPKELLKAREDHAAGRIDDDELRGRRGRRDPRGHRAARRRSACSRRPTASSAASRGTWTSSTRSAGSSKVQDDTIRVHFHNEEREYDWAPPSAHVDGKLSLPRDDLRRRTSRSCATTSRARGPKLTIPSPSMVHYRGGTRAIDDVGLSRPRRVLGRPDRRLRRAGAPAWTTSAAATCSSTTPASPTSTTRRSASTSRRSAAIPSTSTRPTSPTSTARWPAGPTDLAVTTHMCRGNNQSMWAAEGGYDFVAEALFNELEVDGFFLRVGRRALRRLRAAALRAQGQAGRARPGDDQAPASSRARTSSSAGSRRRRSTSTSTSSACRRSAASPRPRRATSSRSTSSSPSCGASSRSPRRSGAEPSGHGPSRWTIRATRRSIRAPRMAALVGVPAGTPFATPRREALP